MQLYSQDGTCPSCLGQSDCMGDHAITCMRHGEIIARHNNIRDAIFEVARSANLAPRKEEAALIPSNNSKPADVLIPNFAGKPLALDVTVVHPLTPARLTSSASNPGQTLITAFNNKCRHTLEACSDEGIVFVPVCQESLGGYHERSASVLKRIALAQSRAKGTDETETIKHFFQKLSIILQKGNCSLLISRVPRSNYAPPSLDGGL